MGIQTITELQENMVLHRSNECSKNSLKSLQKQTASHLFFTRLRFRDNEGRTAEMYMSRCLHTEYTKKSTMNKTTHNILSYGVFICILKFCFHFSFPYMPSNSLLVRLKFKLNVFCSFYASPLILQQILNFLLAVQLTSEQAYVSPHQHWLLLGIKRNETKI